MDVQAANSRPAYGFDDFAATRQAMGCLPVVDDGVLAELSCQWSELHCCIKPSSSGAGPHRKSYRRVMRHKALRGETGDEGKR